MTDDLYNEGGFNERRGFRKSASTVIPCHLQNPPNIQYLSVSQAHEGIEDSGVIIYHCVLRTRKPKQLLYLDVHHFTTPPLYHMPLQHPGTASQSPHKRTKSYRRMILVSTCRSEGKPFQGSGPNRRHHAPSWANM